MGNKTGVEPPNEIPDNPVYHICVRTPDRALVCERMADDGWRPAGECLPMPGITHSTEAPALFQRHGKTYLLASGSSGWAPSAARIRWRNQWDLSVAPLK